MPTKLTRCLLLDREPRNRLMCCREDRAQYSSRGVVEGAFEWRISGGGTDITTNRDSSLFLVQADLESHREALEGWFAWVRAGALPFRYRETHAGQAWIECTWKDDWTAIACRGSSRPPSEVVCDEVVCTLDGWTLFVLGKGQQVVNFVSRAKRVFSRDIEGIADLNEVLGWLPVSEWSHSRDASAVRAVKCKCSKLQSFSPSDWKALIKLQANLGGYSLRLRNSVPPWRTVELATVSDAPWDVPKLTLIGGFGWKAIESLLKECGSGSVSIDLVEADCDDKILLDELSRLDTRGELCREDDGLHLEPGLRSRLAQRCNNAKDFWLRLRLLVEEVDCHD